MGRSITETVLQQPDGNFVIGANQFQGEVAEVIREGGAFSALLTSSFVAAMMSDRQIPEAIVGSGGAEVTFRSSPVPGHIEMSGFGDEIDWETEWLRVKGEMEQMIGGQIGGVRLPGEEYPLGSEDFEAIATGAWEVWNRVDPIRRKQLTEKAKGFDSLLVSSR